MARSSALRIRQRRNASIASPTAAICARDTSPTTGRRSHAGVDTRRSYSARSTSAARRRRARPMSELLREVRGVLEQPGELPLPDHLGDEIGLRDDGGGARSAVQQRDLAEEVARVRPSQRSGHRSRPGGAFHDHNELVTVLALLGQCRPGRELQLRRRAGDELELVARARREERNALELIRCAAWSRLIAPPR